MDPFERRGPGFRVSADPRRALKREREFSARNVKRSQKPRGHEARAIRKSLRGMLQSWS